MMNDWYQRMVDALQLNGKEERTQQAYTRSVRMLSQFYDKTPDLLSEQELQDYFLHRKNVNHWSPKTMRICPRQNLPQLHLSVHRLFLRPATSRGTPSRSLRYR